MGDTANMLHRIAQTLVNQEKAKIIIEPKKRSDGYWFGGGNMVEIDDALYVVGRYRNYGDSRLGTALGDRGCELAIFKSVDEGKSFVKVASFSKEDLSVGERKVVSIEGSALYYDGSKVELFVSTEKTNLVPEGELGDYVKPGTGVWSVDVIKGTSIEALDVSSMETVIEGEDVRHFHIKDPFIYKHKNQNMMLGYCSHPISWASSNSGYLMRDKNNGWQPPVNNFFARGEVWDVAITRVTSIVDIDKTPYSLVFYDGGESLRQLDEHSQAKKRTRGYSCEEIGGVGFCEDNDINAIERLSVLTPSFLSPFGKRTSRYVNVLKTVKGYYVTWQQSQEDFSQPLVLNFVPHEVVNKIING
ncbi:MAG: exo-alpha-sialidase [Acholeplasmataceae bacterium]